MPNRRRGEVGLELGGERYTLCLTLGTLAELEDAFGAPDLQALGARFADGGLSSQDLLKLLAVAIRGGGRDLSDTAVAALPLERGIEPVVAALTDLFLLTFGEPEENPPEPQEV